MLRLISAACRLVVLPSSRVHRRRAIDAELKIGTDLSSGVASQAEVADLLICFAIVSHSTHSHSPAPRRAPGATPWAAGDLAAAQTRLSSAPARAVCRSKRAECLGSVDRQEGIKSHQHREKRFDPYPTVFIPPCQKPVRRRRSSHSARPRAAPTRPLVPAPSQRSPQRGHSGTRQTLIHGVRRTEPKGVRTTCAVT